MGKFDVEVSERVEADLDRLISKRVARLKEEAEQERVEDTWAESARRDRERRHRENREAWCDCYGHMHRLHLSIAADHADRRSRLLLEAGDDGPPPPPRRQVGRKIVEYGK